MLSTDDLKIIRDTVEEFFRKMTIEVEVQLGEQTDDMVPVELKTEEPQLLIGERGQTLSEIQHLLKSILRKKIGSQFYIDLDINDYKRKKSEYLREMARSAAEDVALNRFERELPPMSAYERRIVHMEIAGRSDVVTESRGEEPERRIVIKPAIQ